MDDTQERGSRAIATENRNSNFVLALLHRRPPGRFGHLLVDGLRAFGIPILFGIEPTVYLIAKAAPELTFAGRQANENCPVKPGMTRAERAAAMRQHLRSLGYVTD